MKINLLRNSLLKSGLFLSTFFIAGSSAVYAQSAIDAMRISRPDMKGTARYMSMGGAFGALGGDLTTLSMNPAGIGVYRNHEIGVTVDLDANSVKSASQGGTFSQTNTPFLLNNIGGVLTLKLNTSAVPNLNFGFTYNRTASFHNRYGGSLGNLNTSMTNWMAGVANSEGATVPDVSFSDGFNPYNPTDGGYAAPWMTILAYQSYLINPTGDSDNPVWEGQFGGPMTIGNQTYPATTGTAAYNVEETGGIDSFNIAFGGNFANFLYWGMDFDISNINYTRNTFYQENLMNAHVESDQGIEPTTSNWNLQNWYNLSGNGFTYKLGIILRPIQELRLGVAFHTPTYYSLTQQFSAKTEAYYNGNQDPIVNYSNSDSRGNWEPGYNDMRFVSPWKVMVSAATVLFNRLIVSADYQWDLASKMHWKDPSYYDNYYYYPYTSSNPWGEETNSYYLTNQDIQNYYSDINTLRLGAEFRVTKNFSVRAGYSNVSSGVKQSAADGREIIYTAGTMPDYTFSNQTNYVTAGLGWRKGGFYADFAYVFKENRSTYHAFTVDPESAINVSPTAKLTQSQNEFILSLGYKF